MFCDRCGKALPSVGVVCPHCGAMMNKNQIEIQKKMRAENKKNNRPEYLSDKFGVEKNIEYNNKSDINYLPFIIIIMLFLIILSIVLFIFS